MIRVNTTQLGYSLTEVLLVAGMMGIVTVAIVRFMAAGGRVIQRTRNSQTMMSDSRTSMETIVQRLRDGVARSLVITTPQVGQVVPNSRVDFRLHTPLASGATGYAVYLSNRVIFSQEFGPGFAKRPKALASNVTSLTFTSDFNDPGLVSVNLRIDAPLDIDSTTLTTLILPGQIVKMVEAP